MYYCEGKDAEQRLLFWGPGALCWVWFGEIKPRRV